MSSWIDANKHKPAEFYAYGRESKNVLIAFKEPPLDSWQYEVAYFVQSDNGGHWVGASTNCITRFPDYWKQITPPEIEPI